MIEITNEMRREHGREALVEYGKLKQYPDNEVEDDPTSCISDLISDLLHYAQTVEQPDGEDPVERVLRVARLNYEEEMEDEESEKDESVFGCTCGEEIPLSDKDDVDEHIATCNGEPKEDDDAATESETGE